MNNILKVEEHMQSLRARVESKDWDKADIIIAKLSALWGSLSDDQKDEVYILHTDACLGREID